eukprot:scaffold33420_cov68-Phaeocystis_antarctica.AAC.2
MPRCEAAILSRRRSCAKAVIRLKRRGSTLAISEMPMVRLSPPSPVSWQSLIASMTCSRAATALERDQCCGCTRNGAVIGKRRFVNGGSANGVCA